MYQRYTAVPCFTVCVCVSHTHIKEKEIKQCWDQKLFCLRLISCLIYNIICIAQILRALDRPIVYSLSPGTSVTPSMAKDVSGLVNMYRITGDDWDTWGDVSAHFDISR